jgi:hypothetical protein
MSGDSPKTSEEEHTSLDIDFDRELLEDILDTPDLRYVVLYMFILRKELFQDLEDDDIIETFDTLTSLEEPTVGDVKKLCTIDFIKAMVSFRIITNVKNYKSFQIKTDDSKIKIADGIQLTHEDISNLEEEIHIFLSEQVLERMIAPQIPEMTNSRIHKALERLRAMMCPKTPTIHEVVHKYGDHYILDDNFYYIIEEVGNPFQAIRIEHLIRAMSEKYKEIENNLNTVLNQFDPELIKGTMMKKFRKAKELQKTNYLAYLVKKSRKLSLKYRLKFESDEVPPLYTEWKENLNALIVLKLKFDELNVDMDTLRSYYSGKKQKMPYLKFIEKATFDEDDISEKIKNQLLDSRNSLKEISETIDQYPKKEMKILNLDLERMIIDKGLDEDEEE